MKEVLESMRIFLRSLFLFMTILWPSIDAWAQSRCPKSFNEVSIACIESLDASKPAGANVDAATSTKYSKKPILLTAEMRGNTYFYKTQGGEVGKLKVISTVTSPSVSKPRECTLFVDAVTYAGDKVFVPNSSLSTSVKSNNFLNDIMYLNREGTAAFEMQRLPTNEDGKIIFDDYADSENAKEMEDARNGIFPILSKARIQKQFQKSISAAEGLGGNTDDAFEKAQRILDLKENKIADAQMRCFIVPTSGVEVGYYKKESEDFKKEALTALFYGPLVLIFIAIYLIVRGFMEEQDKFKTQEALEDAENTNKGKNEKAFIKFTKPFYKRFFLPVVQGFKNKQNIKTKYRQKLANAGLTKEITPEEFVALKFFMILGGPFVFLTVRFLMEENWPLIITPVMAIIGYFYPNIWLMGLISKRADETLRAMPFIVDMLALSVEAGLDFMAAIQRVMEKAPPSPLVEEFETLIKETRIGSTRAEGLRQMGWRVNIIEINSFCATLIAADSVGASIAPILKQLSAELRVKRSSRAEQQGATAATKILIPMIFFILPAVLVAIFAPMVLKMMTGSL